MKFVKMFLVAIVAILATACASNNGLIRAPQSAPQPVARQTLPPEVQVDSQLSKKLVECQGLYTGSRESMVAVDNCKRFLLDSQNMTVRNAQQMAQVDQQYRRQTQQELDAEMRRRETAQRANEQTVRGLVQSGLQIYRAISR